MSEGATPVWFEEFGRDSDPEEAYLSEVDSSQNFVAILNEVYGRQDRQTGYSATEMEYLRARERGSRIHILAATPAPTREGLLVRFINDRLRVFHTTEDFADLDDLDRKIRRRLGELASEALSPWVELGHLVFRAEEIEEESDRVTVRAQVGDEVARALDDLRRDQYSSTRLRLAYADSVRIGRVAEVRRRIEAAGSSEVTLELNQLERPRLDPFRSGFNGVSPEEQVEFGLRHQLFGEPLPSALSGGFHHVAETGVDTEALGECFALTNEIAPAITRLVLSDGLVGSGKVSAITAFQLGPHRFGARPLRVEWEASSHPGTPGERHEIEGDWSAGSPSD